MATAKTILIPYPEIKLFDQKQLDPKSAAKVSEVLQENHEVHHIFFNQVGLHNHIVHHILTLYALGASPSKIEHHYLNNRKYQRPQSVDITKESTEEIRSIEEFKSCLRNESPYRKFLTFFQKEISTDGWELVVQRFLFHGDELADDLLESLFTLHPLIHVSYGIEFQQPAIIAEGLALTAIHNKSIGNFLPKAENTAREMKPCAGKPLAEIITEIHADQTIRATMDWDEPRKFKNGPCQKAETEMVRYAAQWKVTPHDFEERMAEIYNGAAFVVGAAQRPPKIAKLDFFFIHGLTTSHALVVVLQQAWISREVKARLVEYMGRLILGMYAGCGAPKLLMEEIVEYEPKQTYSDEDEAWERLISRALDVGDDGHTVKVVRALMHGKMLDEEYKEKTWCAIKDDLWLTICHMCVDSVEVENPDRWVRHTGFPEAWEKFPDRELKTHIREPEDGEKV